MMSMRLAEGSDLDRFAALRGTALPESKLNPLIQDGFLTRDGAQLKATPAGRLVLNRLLLELCA
jgi:coproporphyrinogen III oxidase-like Fe-S oxidoreductase